MSDTPITDAALIERRHIHKRDGSVQLLELVDAEIARKLERKRNSLQDQRDFCMGEIERLRKERDEARDLLSTCMSVMPIGNIKTHTLKNLPTRIGDLASAIAAETEESERLERELYEAQRIIDQYKEMFDMQTKLVVDLEMRLIKMEEQLKK